MSTEPPTHEVDCRAPLAPDARQVLFALTNVWRRADLGLEMRDGNTEMWSYLDLGRVWVPPEDPGDSSPT